MPEIPPFPILTRTLVDDLRYVIRALWRRPMFTSAALLLIAMGSAFTVTTYALVDAVALRKLPAPNPDRLVNLSGAGADRDLPIPSGIYKRLVDRFNGIDQHFGWVSSILQAESNETVE